ncbi:uncharacterized protein DMENIID0001_114510 [Sergentomyia squamirostris]
MISCVFGKVKSFFLGIVTLLRRALCFTRRRRNSLDASDEILQAVNVVSSHRGSRGKNEMDRDWNTWDETPRTVEEHIEVYRQQMAQKVVHNSEMTEPDLDFFGGMEPKVIKQTKVLIKKGNEPSAENKFSRLTATTDATIPYAAELEDWIDESKSGWEEVNEDASKLIREKRREMRAQQKAERQKDASNSIQGFAERIGNRKI